MAAVQPFPGSAFIKVEVDFTGNWNANPPSYTDVTADLRFPISWQRGRNDEYQSISPGRCDFVLNNRAGTYNPSSNANIVPARPARVTCYYPTTGTAYQQIDMMIEDWNPTVTLDGDAVVHVSAVERWGGLQFAQVSGPMILQSAVARLTALCTNAGWPVALTNFAAGSWQCQSQTYSRAIALQALQDTANGQLQVIYQNAAGVLMTTGMFSSVGSSIGGFTDDGRSYFDVTLDVGGGYLYTVAQLTADGGTAWVQGNPNVVTKSVGGSYPQTKYGIRTLALNISAMSQADATSACTSLASTLGSKSVYRAQQIKIKPMANPSVAFPKVLAADLGSPVSIGASGGGGFSLGLIIRSIQHEITNTDWTVTFQTSP